MNIEQHQALQEHIQAIAKILYEETPTEELKTLGDIEQAVRRQMQQYVLPQIGIFLSKQPPALQQGIDGRSKACWGNCP